jgi:hypothetical protein
LTMKRVIEELEHALFATPLFSWDNPPETNDVRRASMKKASPSGVPGPQSVFDTDNARGL